ncbi:bacteriophage holin [Saccharopolyspora sp. NPDC050389]|uniref:bacteriophage holin n=1 Tax=Saccharopolyspora sp. NPDC050389 TaxID=3155516 RepID=UPI0033E6F589
MPYVWSLVLLVVGLVLLALLLVRLFRELRRFKSVQRQVFHDLDDRSGLVKARVAGLKVAFAQRRNR